jgi:NADPH:quinone reductase-like Zn-dependent oxidoreductase
MRTHLVQALSLVSGCADVRVCGWRRLTIVPGCDFVGTVASVGAETSRLSPGDRVAGLIWGGMTNTSMASTLVAKADRAC